MSAARDPESHRLALNSLRLPGFAPRDAHRPFVIALEGANGAGKTTLCGLLSRRLSAPACLGTDAAWFADSFKTRMIRDAEWFSSAMFFLSGCFEQMRVLGNRPEPLVMMDRSLWSTLAVHGAEDADRLQTLLDMLRPVAGRVPVPDLTLVLEATFQTCQSRIARKSGAARLLDELTAVPAFHAREQEFYRWLAGQRSEVFFLNADQAGPDSVADTALTLIREHAGARGMLAPIGAGGKGSADATS
jgi:thymidylate kinase